MRPTETLAKEHSLVLLVTKAAEQEVRYMRDTGEYRQEAIDELVDFFEFFTEACHDPKEERLLFASLCKHGLSLETGVLAQFYQEHLEFHTRLRDIEHWLRRDKKEGPQDVTELADLLDGYLTLMRAHVTKEEDLLFTLANGLLSDDDQEALERGFETAEQEETAVGVRERYSELAHLLLSRPTETLIKEHKICYLVLDAAEREVAAIRAGGDLNEESIGKLVDFFHYFTRECHEPKEGKLLFSKLAQRGMSGDEGLLAEMTRDHDELGTRMESLERHMVKARSGNSRVVASFLDEMDTYITFIRTHMEREDESLFPMVAALLTYRDLEELARAFESVESQEIIEGVHQKYFDLAHQLAIQ